MCERIRVSTLPFCEDVLDMYTVDRYGNVYGTNGIELVKTDNGKGYLYVTLKIKNSRRYKKAYIHRLVGLAFVDGRTEEKSEIDHIDANRKNNRFENLRWCNRKENMQNENTRENMKGMNGVKCFVYDYMLNFVGEFASLSDAENYIGYTIHDINTRVAEYYILDKPDLQIVLKINRKQRLQSVVITDIETFEKFYFYSNREARKFFNNTVNVTQAIQKNWTVHGKYKVRALNYKKLIGMLDL